jgi:hypothetical protein
VAARRRSRRRAGEHGNLVRAQAPARCGESISVRGSAGEVTMRAVNGEVDHGRCR